MTNELYVTGVIIANGIADSDGDILDKKQIKQIFTKYTNQDTDTMHTYIKNEGVDVIANWITETPVLLNGQNVPAGSWLATTKVTNEELINNIENNRLTGYSLGSVPNKAFTEDYWFINKSVKYRDIPNIEDITPLFISFVDRPANQFSFEVVDYTTFINKNEKEEKQMTEQEVNVGDDTIKISTLEKIREIFGINKSADAVEKEPVIETEPVEAEPTFDANEFAEKIENAVADGIKIGIEKATEIKEEPAEEEEAVEEEPAEEEAVEEVEAETEVEEDIKINKRETVKEDVQQKNDSTNFYKLSGRDAFGCRIKK